MSDMKPDSRHARKKNAPKARVGLQQIAEAANVSMATVSRVLRGNNQVDPAIQKAVRAEAQKLGIDPSQRNKNRTLAFCLSNRTMLHTFHSRILSGAEAYAAANGWEMLYLSFKYSLQISSTDLNAPKVLLRHDMVRAAILAGSNSTSLVKLLTKKGIPVAVFGNNVFGDQQELEKHDTVFVDDIQGGADATQYLIRLGHRDIWFVGNTKLPWFARCFDGYRRAMRENKLEPRHSSIDSEADAETGYLGTKSLLARNEPVTAIFAGNDSTAHGVYKALFERGVRVPHDVSVIGCDDTVGTLLTPALSTIREFPEQIGMQLVDLALKHLAKPDGDPQHITIPTEFVKRESCALPRTADALAPGNTRLR